MSQVLEDSRTFQTMMERMRWTLRWSLPQENGEEEALRAVEVEVLHQNQPSVPGISLLFVRLSLFVLFFFVICYAAVKSCCSITCLIMNIAVQSLSLEFDNASRCEQFGTQVAWAPVYAVDFHNRIVYIVLKHCTKFYRSCIPTN